MPKVFTGRVKKLRTLKSPTQCSSGVKFYVANMSPHWLKRRKAKCDAWGWDINKCTGHAAYIVDGEHLCAKHAGGKALKILAGDRRK
jgi:hypothetical protein